MVTEVDRQDWIQNRLLCLKLHLGSSRDNTGKWRSPMTIWNLTKQLLVIMRIIGVRFQGMPMNLNTYYRAYEGRLPRPSLSPHSPLQCVDALRVLLNCSLQMVFLGTMSMKLKFWH